MLDIWSVLGISIPSSGAIGGLIGWIISRAALEKYKTSLSVDVEKIKNDLTKDVETLKSKLGNHTYTSKVKFDLEVEAYRELTIAFYEMKIATEPLFDDNDHFKSRVYEENRNLNSLADSQTRIAAQALEKNSPFISPEMYDSFKAMFEECSAICFIFDANIYRKDHAVDPSECYERCAKLHSSYMAHMGLLREHISKMRIAESPSKA